MKRWTVLAAGLLLPGCVPPPAYGPAYAGYGLRPDPVYRQAYAPGFYGQPALLPPPLLPLPENASQQGPAAARARTAAPRPRPPAPPAVTAAAAAPSVDPGAAIARAAAPAPAGPECRTVTQVGYADGKEVQRQERFCRAAPGKDWVKS